MPDLHQIPHLDEIAHHGEYHGVGKRVTETDIIQQLLKKHYSLK